MKVRITLLAIAALSMLGILAHAPTATAQPIVTTASLSSPAEPASGCGNSTASAEALDFSKLFPNSPVEMAGTCGSCSLSPCVGASIGQGCSINLSTRGTCQNVYGERCSPSGNMCQCWRGPLP